MLDRLDAALRFQQEALNLRAQRQEILAANIAMPIRRGIRRAILILPVS
ncbi:flagellar basal-body rod protein FlgB [Salmonella enterica subsp. enterica]|uniref:Flagellar basal-body rod protein FlgB n=1 Tax=Salmonella enterica I TaxID=59201 RepID=A0A379WW23_SALET|nr:flagellar basal-body rod protein FlgB [Salmonella enterica subsp. enterica]